MPLRRSFEHRDYSQAGAARQKTSEIVFTFRFVTPEIAADLHRPRLARSSKCRFEQLDPTPTSTTTQTSKPDQSIPTGEPEQDSETPEPCP
jgi:hypothetical protein